jgi:hypothetical protein
MEDPMGDGQKENPNFLVRHSEPLKRTILRPMDRTILWVNYQTNPITISHETMVMGGFAHAPLRAKQTYVKCYAELNPPYLIIKRHRDYGMANYADLRNVRIDTFDGLVGNNKLWFIILSVGPKFDNLVFADRSTRDKWYYTLLTYCIGRNFNSYYLEKEKLGNGRYGVVRVCKKIGDENHVFAVKKYNKKEIFETDKPENQLVDSPSLFSCCTRVK